MRRFCDVDTVELDDLILQKAFHALDLLPSLVVALWVMEGGRTQEIELVVYVTQLPIQILGFVALLLNPLHRWMRTKIVL